MGRRHIAVGLYRNSDKKAAPLPTSTAADAGKLLQVGADGKAKWGDKLPTALKTRLR